MSVSLCYRAFDTLGLFHALLCKWRLSVVPGILITSGSQTDSCLWGIVLPHLCNVFCVCGTFHSVSQSSLWALIKSCGIPSWHVLYCIYAFIEGWASICFRLVCAEVTGIPVHVVCEFRLDPELHWREPLWNHWASSHSSKVAVLSAIQEKETLPKLKFIL